MILTSSWIWMEEQSHSLLQGKLALLVNLGPFAEMFPWSSSWLIPEQAFYLPSREVLLGDHFSHYFLCFVFLWSRSSMWNIPCRLLTHSNNVQSLNLIPKARELFFWHSNNPWACVSLDASLQFFIKRHDLHQNLCPCWLHDSQTSCPWLVIEQRYCGKGSTHYYYQWC